MGEERIIVLSHTWSWVLGLTLAPAVLEHDLRGVCLSTASRCWCPRLCRGLLEHDLRGVCLSTGFPVLVPPLGAESALKRD